jgi:hypothetical protein
MVNNDLYSQCLTQTLSKTTSITKLEGVFLMKRLLCVQSEAWCIKFVWISQNLTAFVILVVGDILVDGEAPVVTSTTGNRAFVVHLECTAKVRKHTTKYLCCAPSSRTHGKDLLSCVHDGAWQQKATEAPLPWDGIRRPLLCRTWNARQRVVPLPCTHLNAQQRSCLRLRFWSLCRAPHVWCTARWPIFLFFIFTYKNPKNHKHNIHFIIFITSIIYITIIITHIIYITITITVVTHIDKSTSYSSTSPLVHPHVHSSSTSIIQVHRQKSIKSTNSNEISRRGSLRSRWPWG